MMRFIVCCIIKVLISIECCCRSRGMVKDVKPLLGRALLGTRQRLRYACWIHFHGTAISRDTSILIIKTRHCISGWGRVVSLGLGLTHCHRLRPADGGGCNLPRCQCSHSFRLKSYFFLFFPLILQVFVFLQTSTAE